MKTRSRAEAAVKPEPEVLKRDKMVSIPTAATNMILMSRLSFIDRQQQVRGTESFTYYYMTSVTRVQNYTKYFENVSFFIYIARQGSNDIMHEIFLRVKSVDYL